MRLLKLTLWGSGLPCALNPHQIEVIADSKDSTTRIQVGSEDWIIEGPYHQILKEWEEALGDGPYPDQPDLDDDISF